MADHTTPDDETKATEDEEATAAHTADRAPTSEEEEAADRALQDPELSGDQEEVGKHYREMTERGVDAKGEGEIK